MAKAIRSQAFALCSQVAELEIRASRHYLKSIKKTHLTMSLLYGAGDEARTRDILLGKEAFYH